MRILMLSSHVPGPAHGGGAIRICHLLRELSQRGHQIVLLAGQEGPLPPSRHIFNSCCEELHTYKNPPMGRLTHALRSIFSALPYGVIKLRPRKLREQFLSLLRSQRFDLIWVNVLYMADALLPDTADSTVVILDETESVELVWRGYLQKGNWLERLFALTNLIKLKKFMERILPRLDAVLCVSETEAVAMQGRVPSRVEVWTVPNGVDVDFFRLTPLWQREPNSIMLGGIMGVRRNIDAAVWFVQRIFPKVRKSIPEAELWIVGASPSREIWRLQRAAGVRVTGTVEDIRDYYAKAKVFVAPYRFGAGTRLKILEAMATGTPIVSTRAGCQGIDVVDGQHLLIANNEADFAERTIELLRNAERGQRLAAAGRALVEEKYRWEQIIGGLEPKLHELVGRQQANRLAPM